MTDHESTASVPVGSPGHTPLCAVHKNENPRPGVTLAGDGRPGAETTSAPDAPKGCEVTSVPQQARFKKPEAAGCSATMADAQATRAQPIGKRALRSGSLQDEDVEEHRHIEQPGGNHRSQANSFAACGTDSDSAGGAVHGGHSQGGCGAAGFVAARARSNPAGGWEGRKFQRPDQEGTKT